MFLNSPEYRLVQVPMKLRINCLSRFILDSFKQIWFDELNPFCLFRTGRQIWCMYVNKIVHGKRGITPESAWLFAEAFGISPEFWLNLQANYDLVRSKPKRQVECIATIA